MLTPPKQAPKFWYILKTHPRKVKKATTHQKPTLAQVFSVTLHRA